MLKPEVILAPSLTRLGDEAQLETLPGKTLQDITTSNLEPGFDLFASETATVNSLHMLARHGGCRLNLGDDPQAAVDLLEEMTGRVGTTETVVPNLAV